MRKIKLMEMNEAYQKVLYYFFSFPDMETGLNDLSSELRIAKTTSKRVVQTLVNEGFLFVKEYGKAWRITCNKEHEYNATKKLAFNMEMVYGAYQNGLRDLIMEQVGSPKAVILFGSYRKGDDTEKSDMDIAVEKSGDESINIIELAEIPQFGYRTNVKISLHIFSKENVDINLFSNIANGIVLEGFLEVRP